MTEAEWFAATDPSWMLRFLEKQSLSERKFRRFAVTCCGRIRERLPDDRCRMALETCERYVEGLAGPDELAAAHDAAEQAFVEFDDRDGWETAASAVSAACYPENMPVMAGQVARESAALVGPRFQRRLEYRWQSKILRCIFGNPFRPVAADPSWLSSIAVDLANGVYADRAFDRLPILADALQDAGCEDADLLGHLWGDGPHVRGCWALDLVLGKE